MPSFPKLTWLFCLIFCSSIGSLYAQDDSCLRFEDLPADAVYGKDSDLSPGDLAFSLKGVDVYVQEFIYSTTENPGFWNASVTSDIFGNPQPGMDGQYLFISNINLQFDFSKLDYAVNGLCFQVVDGGGEENIAVNGEEIKVIPNFLDAPTEIAPDVFLSVTPLEPTPGTYPRNFQVCLRGKIENLTIGGQEFGFDNLCLYPEPCTLDDLKAEIVNCRLVDDIYVYDLHIDLSLQSTNNSFFDLYVNNTFRGYYSIEDLPVLLKEVRIPANIIDFPVEVCLNDRPDCCQRIEIPNAGCPDNCQLEAVDIGEIECSFDGHYYTTIDVKGANLSGMITITNEMGATWTGPADGSERVKFPIPSQHYDRWIVCDDQNPDCCFTFDFEVPCAPCRIGALQVETAECADDGTFYFRLDFEHFTPTGQFYVYVNNEKHSAHAYSNLPILIGPFTNNEPDGWKILVKDASEQCAEDIFIEAVSCNPAECKIGALHFSEPICTDDGQFYFELNFEHAGNTDKFLLYLNGELYESYAYGNLPVKVGPLPGVADKDWHVLVRDAGSNSNNTCASDANLPAVNCPIGICEIGEVKISDPICAENNQFYFELNFEHAHTSDKFQVLLNQDVYESYAYSDLPIKVGPLPAGTGQDWHILVRDLGGAGTSPCASDGKLAAVNCQGDPCSISGLDVIEYHCTNDGEQFYAVIDFDHKNTSDVFELYLFEELYGTYAYNELPVKIGPLNALIDVEWKVLVKDHSGECGEDIYFSAPGCEPGGGDCHFSNLKIERYPCVGGQFLVDLSFDIKDPGPQGYYVFTNGKITGPHSYDQPYITLGPFTGDGTTTYDFLVIDIEDPSCYGYYELEPVDCSNPCFISNVFAEAHECGEDGGFLVDIAFDYDKVGGSGFTIRGNGVEYGKFEYGKPFYTIGPLNGDGSTVYEFVIIDNDNPDCRSFTTLEAPDCLPCSIGELDYQIQCLNNSKHFLLKLDFPYDNPASERFVVAIGDHIIGTYKYAALPIQLEPELPENGSLILAVWDAEEQTCTQKTEFTIPCCYLGEPIVEAHPCENDGELWIDLDLKHYNTSASFKLVYGQGDHLRSKIYKYSELPITLGSLSGQSTGEWYFEVTDQGYYCQSSTYLETAYCDNDACAEWDEVPLGPYGPLTGYQPGDEIAGEDGLRLAFANNNPPDCECSVFVMKATTFPNFSEANGQVILLDNSGINLSAPGYDLTSLSLDYLFRGTEVLLQINGEATIAVSSPLNLPTDIAAGVTLSVTPHNTNGRRGTMTFSGKIRRISFMSRGEWVLDNFCAEKTEQEDEVWPGDTNSDNIANHLDLLNIGLAYGENGPERPTDNIGWAPQEVENWNGFFNEQQINYKHADANGDGTINRQDRSPILENYGLTHGPIPVFSGIPATDNDPPLFTDFNGLAVPIPVGGTFQVPIIFGTENQPVKDIYGLAFTIEFDPAVIDPTSVEVVYPDSWLGSTQEDLLTLDRTEADQGRINIAITRINKINTGGYGPIAALIGAIDDIAGKETVVSITEVMAITALEDRIPVNGKASKVEFSDKLKEDIGYIDLSASLNIFPNPTSSEVLITTRYNFPIQRIRIMDSYGNPTGIQVEGKNRIDLSELPSGIYMMRIQLDKYTISRKIIKVN
ncbi:MAG: T9SS type A sorting domain-containing protein [Saprospiraceae bacterium]|nr:T9SS type A sorting domain-containing protein [Lewinella sp.]